MTLPNYKKYLGFKITYFFPDPGVEEFVQRFNPQSRHPEIETFLNYKYAIDSTHCKEVEVIDVKPRSKIILPCSKNKDCAKVSYVGPEPEFLGLNKDKDLEAIIPAECCVRVEFGGAGYNKQTHVKFFKTV